jgi:hypothetical protein
MEVQKEYNQATVKNRWRTTKQVKDRWYKINKLTNLFNDCWLKAKRVYTGGYSDEMWLEKAHKFFEEENKGLRFQLTNVWYMVRNEAKWMSYNDHSQGKRKEMEKGSTQEGGLEDVTSLCGACSYAMAAALITHLSHACTCIHFFFCPGASGTTLLPLTLPCFLLACKLFSGSTY